MKGWKAVLRTPLGLTATVLTAGVLVLAVVAPILWTDDANAIDTDNILAGPSADHWAGTDNLGRDIVYRTLVATRLSVELALAATLIAVVVGLLLGTASFLLGRRSGRAVNTGINIAVAFPGLLLALFFAVIFGVGAAGAVLAIGLAGAPAFGRLTQTLVACVASRDFVAAAQIAGVGRLRILFRHVLPNVAEPLVVNATIGAGGALLSFAGPVVPRPRRAAALLRLGPAALGRRQLDLRQPGRRARPRHRGDHRRPLASTCSASPSPRPSASAWSAGSPPCPPSLAAVEGGEPPADDVHAPTDLVLDVRDLEVTFPGPAGPIRPVRGISFAVRRGEAVGVVGESGSGKSLTALAVSRLVGDPGRVDASRLELLGTDLRTADTKAQRHLLGTSLAMVFQDPMTSFNPARRMGGQLAEVARHHQGMDRKAALARAVDRMRAVRIDDPERRAHQYPHEFSGGMRQRAMIGMGLMGSPALIVADEPTTALDVTVQQQVLDLLASIRAADDVALVLISHDVTVVGEVCDRVLVMYAGRIVEDLPADELATGGPAPLHPRPGRRRARHGHRPRRAARGHPGPAGRPRRRTARLRLRRPLPARLRALRHRGPAARDRRRRPPGRLLARRRADRHRDPGPRDRRPRGGGGR